MHAILIWFDHLPYAAPGCCGNTEARTPGFDHFAAGSTTFHNCFVVDHLGECGLGLVEELQRLSEEDVGIRVLAVHPTQLVGLMNRRAASEPGNAVTVEMLDDDDQLWQQISAAAEDAASQEAGSRSATIVSLPGVVTAQGEVVGELLESSDRLLDRLTRVPNGDQTLLLVTAAAGSPEGPAQHPLHERRIHVPLLGRIGRPLEFGAHSSSLISLDDVTGALSFWTAGSQAGAPAAEAMHAASLLEELRGQPRQSRVALMLRGPMGMVGVRTRQWYLVARWEMEEGDSPKSRMRSAESAALYCKPDDLWESLDVASQSPAVVDELVAMLRFGMGKSTVVSEKHR